MGNPEFLGGGVNRKLPVEGRDCKAIRRKNKKQKVGYGINATGAFPCASLRVGLLRATLPLRSFSRKRKMTKPCQSLMRNKSRCIEHRLLFYVPTAHTRVSRQAKIQEKNRHPSRVRFACPLFSQPQRCFAAYHTRRKPLPALEGGGFACRFFPVSEGYRLTRCRAQPSIPITMKTQTPNARPKMPVPR